MVHKQELHFCINETQPMESQQENKLEKFAVLYSNKTP